MRQHNTRLLRQSLAELTYIHLFVNGTDPNAHAVARDGWRWTIPFAGIQDTLELVGPRRYNRHIIIDGYEPFLDEKSLVRLVALLSLYAWTPIVRTIGSFLSVVSNPQQVVQRVARAGFFEIQLNLTAADVERVGLAALSSLYREARKHFLLITTRYHLEDTKASRATLQNLLSCDDVNRNRAWLYIASRIPSSSKDFDGRRLIDGNKSDMEVTLGHKGTLAVASQKPRRIRYCSIFNQNWKEEFSAFFAGEYDWC